MIYKPGVLRQRSGAALNSAGRGVSASSGWQGVGAVGHGRYSQGGENCCVGRWLGIKIIAQSGVFKCLSSECLLAFFSFSFTLEG